MIREIHDAILLSKVFALADQVPDITPAQFKAIVCERLIEKTSVMIVDELEGQVRGFLFCTLDGYKGDHAFVIQYAYIAPDKFRVGAELLNRACLLANALGKKEVFMVTSRNPEGFVRKYKFEVSHYVLRRSI